MEIEIFSIVFVNLCNVIFDVPMFVRACVRACVHACQFLQGGLFMLDLRIPHTVSHAVLSPHELFTMI